MRLALVFAVALVLAGDAFGGWGSDDLRLRVCGVETIITDPVPGKATARIRVFANGHELEGASSAPYRADFFGRDVAVVVRSTKKTGPLRFRVANLRLHGCSRVRLVYRWYAP